MTPEQTMKPATAAKKLGIHLPAAPEEFQQGLVSRSTLSDLQSDPPEWLVELRKNGPHPRQVAAAKLGVSIAGLGRAEMSSPMTTTEIADLLQNPPKWLVTERATQAEVREQQKRLKAKAAAAQ